MISVLLIEDNKLAMEYLKSLIDWEKHGFSVVGTALNGKEGLNKYYALRPRVVITDIQMPALSGVELVERIREDDGETRIIFLTSYQLFSYAKSAMDFGVSEYILKHELNEKSLIQKLEKIKIELGYSDVISRLRFECGIADNILGESEGQLPDSDARCAFLVFRRDSPLDVLNRGDSITTSIDISQAKKACYSHGDCVMGVVQAENGIFLLFASLGATSVNDFAYGLKDTLETEIGGSFTILIIGESIRLKDSRQQFLAYKDMLHDRFFIKRSIVLHSVFFDSEDRSSDVCFEESAFMQAISAHDIDSVLKQIDSAFLAIIKHRNYNGLLDVSRKLMSILMKHENAGSMSFAAQFRPYISGDEDKWYSAAGTAEFFRRKFIELIGILGDDKSEQYSPHVKTAIRFLAADYNNVELSVESIAERIGMNADWLGTIFKRDTGYSVREYLNMYRIKKSKELIDSGFKVPDVYMEVGYMTYQYFGKVFRKITGLTPIEYRRSKNDQTH